MYRVSADRPTIILGRPKLDVKLSDRMWKQNSRKLQKLTRTVDIYIVCISRNLIDRVNLSIIKMLKNDSRGEIYLNSK